MDEKIAEILLGQLHLNKSNPYVILDMTGTLLSPNTGWLIATQQHKYPWGAEHTVYQDQWCYLREKVWGSGLIHFNKKEALTFHDLIEVTEFWKQ